MKNMTAVVLALLMMTSYLAVIDMTEFEEPMAESHESSARTGADPSVLAITTPKETVCDLNGCRNTLEVGETTTFSAYIQNVGDAAADDLSYSVTVYLTDSSGGVGNVASDANGNDLMWENLDAMCDDGSTCDFDSTSTPHPFGPNAYLGGGKLTLQQGGSDIEWTPSEGQYIIQIAVSSLSDADIANNVEQIDVTVTDWYDIDVDLAWDASPDQDSYTLPQADTTAFFTLSVTATGSDTFDPRNVSVRMALSGDVDSAQGTLNGNQLNLTQNAGITVLDAGTSTNVEVFSNITDPNATISAGRNVISYQNTWTFQGSVTVDSSNNDSRVTIDAEVLGYTLYGQFDQCVETFDNTVEGEEENITIYNNFCEVDFSNDDRPGTDEDSIAGTKSTYHDIAISRVGIYQGYNADGTGLPTSFVEAGTGQDLNVGVSRLYAEVQHRGSDAQNSYGWDVVYSVTKDGVNVANGTVNECPTGLEMSYTHQPLGGQPGASLTGFVCVEITLAPGEYVFDVEIMMKDRGSTPPQGPGSWVGAFDARSSNNDARMVSGVVNNLPLITSFELVTEGDLVVGMEGFLEFSVNAFDVDDPSGSGLMFNFTNQYGAFEGCSGSAADGATLCSTPLTADFVGNLAVNVIVTDVHGGQVSSSMMLDIWNAAVGTGTSASGVEFSYPLEYFANSQFTISTFEDVDLSTYAGVVLPGYTGSYDAVAAVNYVPSTTFAAADVLTQSLSVTVPNALGATSLWYIDSNDRWILFDGASAEAGPTQMVFNYDIPANSPVVPAGTFVMMGGQLAQATIPTATVSGFSANSLMAGGIGISWNITGTLLDSDSVRVCVSDAQGVGLPDCANEFNTTVADTDRSYTYSDRNLNHGTMLYVSVAVCNEQGCSTAGMGTATVDREVEGDVRATGLTVTADGDNWVVSWTVEGNADDVEMWHVCYMRGEEFTAATMPTDCPDSVMSSGNTSMSMTIAMPTITGTYDYYFTAVPMDALGNMDSMASMNDIAYSRAGSTDNMNDNNGTIGETGDSASSGIPAAAWGAIAGVIIVAFVVGAFILSRGDGEGGEDEKWDY